MALTRQQKWYAYQRNLKQQMSSGDSGGGGGYSAAAQAVIDSFPVAPTSAEQDKIATFVDAETTAGNWAKYDSFALFTLSNEQNALWDWIQLQSMTAVNAPTHGANGYTFDGSTQYLNSNYDVSSDAINWALSDAQFGCYIYNNPDENIISFLCGQESTTTGSSLIWQNASSDVRLGVNSSDGITSPIVYGLSSSTLFYGLRAGSGSQEIYENGAETGTSVISSGQVDGPSFFIAARNKSGVADFHFNCTLSTWFAGAVLADQSTHYTNIQALLA